MTYIVPLAKIHLSKKYRREEEKEEDDEKMELVDVHLKKI